MLIVLAPNGGIGIILTMTKAALRPRSLQILQALVKKYIEEGQPVGSTALARDSQLMVSSATIRNIMADLEHQGYLSSPHTSSGRVPTSQGYRLFIDHFITVQQPAQAQLEAMKDELDPDCNGKLLAQRASSLLSGITQLTGIVTLPRFNQTLLRHVEFLPLSDCRVLVILVFNDHEVQNRVIHTQRQYTRQELEKAGQRISALCCNKALSSIRDGLLDEMKQQRFEFEAMLASIVNVAEEIDQKNQDLDFVVEGESNLFGLVPNQNMTDLKKLFDAFTQKQDLLHLLDQSIQAQDLKIFVGQESGYDVLEGYSVVMAPYHADGKVVGVLGVVGPQRMQYDKVISTVDVTAKILSNAFDFPQS